MLSQQRVPVTLWKFRKSNIHVYHQAIKLLLSYCANKASEFVLLQFSHDKMTRRGFEEMLINRSAHELNK